MAVRISWFLFLAFMGANLLLTFAADDVDKETCGGICMRVLGESGKVAIVRCGKGKKKDYGKANYAKAFTIELAFIAQRNKTGGLVGKPVSSLAKQKFNFSKQLAKVKHQGLDVMKLEFEGSHQELGAKLHAAAFIACQAGNITFGDETYGAQNGSLKLIFKLENYPFCEGNKTSLCKKGDVGEHLDFGLLVKSRGGKDPIEDKDGDNKKRQMPRRSIRRSKHFKFGNEDDGDEMVAASQCENDGKFVNMSDDFPKVLTVGNRQLLVFRIPKFANRTRFDPGVTMGTSEVEDGPAIPTEPSKATFIHLSVLMVVVMATALFTFM